MRFRKKRFKGGRRRSFGGGSRQSFGGGFRRRFSSFRPRFRSMGRGFKSFRSPIRFNGFPGSHQVNRFMPLVIVGGVLYMFVPAVKNAINKLFHHND
ncbi:MAG: hypothetical protein JWQ09_1137 [Segetibacter sp.]|nr:hypothetical protein [Segetibacter sp.]